jgi:poly-gamma-glutamate capsule biosynthesis protein CapA/YwtB (metallophosphatase superfamily)
MIDAGADLIIGHGAHMMQEVEKYRGHWIIYNIGNFIFNSKGRYKRYKVEPFSLVVQFVLTEKSIGIEKILRLYPILTDNMITKYQSRFLTKDEFDKAYLLLLKKSDDTWRFKKDIRIGRDDIGRFMELSM